MPTIQHITSMQRRASASGGNAGTRTVLDVDFGSVPRSSGSAPDPITNPPAPIDDATGEPIILEGSVDVFYVNPGQAVVVKSGSHVKRLFHIIVEAVIWAPQSEA